MPSMCAAFQGSLHAAPLPDKTNGPAANCRDRAIQWEIPSSLVVAPQDGNEPKKFQVKPDNG